MRTLFALMLASVALGLVACAGQEQLPDLPAVPTPTAQIEDAG